MRQPRYNAVAALLLAVGMLGGCVSAEYEGFRLTRFASDTGLESASIEIDPETGSKKITIQGYRSEQSKVIDLAADLVRSRATP